MIRTAVVHQWRMQSYDWDWLDAIDAETDARFIDMRRDPRLDAIAEADLIILHHSTSAMQKDKLPPKIVEALGKRTAPLVWFVTNEFRDFERRTAEAKQLGAKIATQLPIGVAREKYLGVDVIAMPAALNPDAYYPKDKPRTATVGYRGSAYSSDLGDDHRNRLIKAAKHAANSDVECGPLTMLARPIWANALNTWRSTICTEAGLVGAKCVSSRAFDAIGCETPNIAVRGYYNGILQPVEHYVPLSPGFDEMEFAGALAYAISDQGVNMAKRAREEMLNGHTYRHRIRDLLGSI